MRSLRTLFKYALIFLVLSLVWVLVIELYMRPGAYLSDAFEHYSVWQIYLAVPMNAFLCGGCGVLLGTAFRNVAAKLSEKSSITPAVSFLAPTPSGGLAPFVHTSYFLGGQPSLVWFKWFDCDPKLDSSKEFFFPSSSFWTDDKAQANRRLESEIKRLYEYANQNEAFENLVANSLEDVVHALATHRNNNLMWYGIIKKDAPVGHGGFNSDVSTAKKRYLTWACIFQLCESAKATLAPPNPFALNADKLFIEQIEQKAQMKLGSHVELPAPLLVSLWLNATNNLGGQTISL